jgi:hypothetical protein
MRFQNRRYLILNTEELQHVNFNQVLETSADTCRLSVDGTKSFVKYEINVVEEDIVEEFINPETEENQTYITTAGVYGRPSFYEEDMTEYTHEEILATLAGPEWTEKLGQTG